MSDSVCKDLYSTQRTYHITIIIYLTQLNAGPEFRFGNFSISQVFTLRKNYNAYKDTRQQCSNYTVDFGEPISFFLSSFFFFITGGFCALAMGLQRYIKAMGGGGNYIYMYIYMFFSKYIFLRFNFSRFRFFRFHFMDSFLMIKLN